MKGILLIDSASDCGQLLATLAASRPVAELRPPQKAELIVLGMDRASAPDINAFAMTNCAGSAQMVAPSPFNGRKEFGMSRRRARR